MPLTKQSPIQNQGSQPLMSTRGVVEKQYSDSDLNFNSVPYGEQTLGYSTKLSPDQIRSVNKYSDKQIPVPEDEGNNSFSSINDSYNKMFSDYESYSFDPMKRAPTKEKRKVSMALRDPSKGAGFYDDPKNYTSVTLDAGPMPSNEFSDKYSGVKKTDLPSFEKNKSYQQDLLKNPALSMFDERASFVDKFNTLWKPNKKYK
jgi:hypothetical protein